MSSDARSWFLAAIEGFIQCDDYKGYSSMVTLADGNSGGALDVVQGSDELDAAASSLRLRAFALARLLLQLGKDSP